MIVDDEPINIKLIQKYLRGAGYHDFVTTSESREAISLICNDQRLAHLPVLIVTAATEEQTQINALELGATDFLHKPV